MYKVNPNKPGASSDCDEFKDPWGRINGPSSGGHVGTNRDDSGNFSNKGFSRGGSSPDGEEYVSKYRPGGSGAAEDNGVPEGSELNDEGNGYA